jgi:hypothetical protein
MKKLVVLLFGLSLLGFSLVGMSDNSYYIQLFLNLSKPYVLVRAALVMVLAAYAFVPQVRLHATRNLLSIGGTILLSLGIISVSSPTLLGHAGREILVGDTLTLIEGGILAIILSAELPARRSRLMAKSYLYIKSQLAARPRKLTYSPMPVVKPFKLKAQH